MKSVLRSASAGAERGREIRIGDIVGGRECVSVSACVCV